jgi:hypothetical protein
VYSDPTQIQYADIDCTVGSLLAGATVTVNLAPFYTTQGASTAIPRFAASTGTVTLPAIVKIGPGFLF